LESSASVIGSDLFVSAKIGGIHLGEEPVGVVGQMIRISQNLLHSHATGGNLLQSLMLLNQRILQGGGVLIQDRRRFEAEVINYGGACLA